MKWVKISEICKTTQGIQIEKSNQYNISKESSIRYLYIEDFKSEAELKFIDFQESKHVNKIVTEADLVMANTGSPGAIFKGVYGVLSNNLFKISFDNEILDRDYLYYILSSNIFQRMLGKKMKGGIQKHLGHKTIGEQYIPIYSKDKQQEIVKALDKAKKLVDLRQFQITALDELIQSLFLEMFGDPISTINKFPKRPLSDFGEIITGNTPSRKEPEYYGNHIEWIKSDNINTPYHYLTKAEEFLSEKGLEKGRLVPENSILVTCIAGSKSCIGNAAIADRPVTFNQQINAIVPNGNPYFLYTQFIVGKKLIKRASTDGMKGLVSKGAFQKVEFIDPPLNLQNEFGERFLAIQNNKQVLMESLKHLENLYNALLQKVFKGELLND